MKEYAPILICTLSRYLHFKACIESLLKCISVEKTTLFIGLDYPKNESHWYGYNEILNYIPRIYGFKSVVLVKREYNYGAEGNVKDLQRFIFKTYSKIIITEDDNLFGTTFLEYMNDALDKFEGRSDIFSVSGYNTYKKMPVEFNTDVYLWCAYCGWGVGMWKEKWERIDWSIESLNKMLETTKTKSLLNKYYKRYVNQILRIKESGKITGDGYILLYMIHNNMFSVFPRLSLVRNIGTDGSGVNAVKIKKNYYLQQEIYEDSQIYFIPHEIKSDSKIIEFKMKEIAPTILATISFYMPSKIRKLLKKILSL